MKKPTNKQIVEIFQQAKEYLAQNYSEQVDDVNPKTQYICWAIDTVYQHNDWAKTACKEIIEGRLGIDPISDASHTVTSWLYNHLTVKQYKHMTLDAIQAYRHRWLDSLIEEFESK